MRRSRPARCCDAPGCTEKVTAGKLMCRAHWFALPSTLRSAISSTWKARQITAWSANCLEARNYLATNDQRRAALRDRQLGEKIDA